MPRPATHDGHCQLCGHLQRLPNGKLAKHGYDTRWGFFNGVCPGSGHGPIETCTDLLVAAAQGARAAAARLTGEADQAISLTDGVWVLEPTTLRGRAIQKWRLLKLGVLGVDTDGVYFLKWTGEDGRACEQRSYDRNRPIIPELNNRRAKALQALSQQQASYAAWLEQRLRDWTAAPLIPREQNALPDYARPGATGTNAKQYQLGLRGEPANEFLRRSARLGGRRNPAYAAWLRGNQEHLAACRAAGRPTV